VGIAFAQGLVAGQAAGMSSKPGVSKAKKTLHKVLGVHPSHSRALFALVDLYVREKDYSACIELLKKGLEGNGMEPSRPNQDLILCKLGELHALSEHYPEAIECFHQTLGLNPEMTAAQRHLDRLEKMDPNDPGGDEIIEDSASAESPQQGAGGGGGYRSGRATHAR
jgi:tetratricopeptide (TPR) repeat protein